MFLLKKKYTHLSLYSAGFDIEESVNVKLLLSRSFISNILFYMGSEYVRSEESDDLNLSDGIIQIS